MRPCQTPFPPSEPQVLRACLSFPVYSHHSYLPWWALWNPAPCSLSSQFNPCSLSALLLHAVLQQLQHEYLDTRSAYVAALLTYLTWLPTALKINILSTACPPTSPACLASSCRGGVSQAHAEKDWKQRGRRPGTALLNLSDQGLVMSWENRVEDSWQHSMKPGAPAGSRQ